MASPAPASQDDIIQQEILKAAIRLYQKSGPNSFTMDDLANATGRSRTSLYYYYKNRDEIYQAVMDKIARDMTAAIRLAVAAVETPARQGLCLLRYQAQSFDRVEESL